MKTARQAGWSLATSENFNDKFISLSNESGDYLEMFVIEPGIAVLRPFDTGIGIWDLPESVLSLCALWLGIDIPFQPKGG